jgi:ABC-type transporter Mla MlaB component
MLRITLVPATDVVRLVLEGRLVEAWAMEADATWQQALAQRGTRALEVDVREVMAVDAAGRTLLARMARDGARLLACGCAMREMVREIAAANRPAAGSRPVGEERVS